MWIYRNISMLYNLVLMLDAYFTGNKIAVIENVGATEDQFDCIDLSDNEIVKLENFPYLNRLGTLLLNNNRITRINSNIGEFLPNLHSLVLTNNRLVNLVEIDPLASFPKLTFLSLLDNNITKKPNYRLYVIHKLKSLRLLDFKKVKLKVSCNRVLLDIGHARRETHILFVNWYDTILLNHHYATTVGFFYICLFVSPNHGFYPWNKAEKVQRILLFQFQSQDSNHNYCKPMILFFYQIDDQGIGEKRFDVGYVYVNDHQNLPTRTPVQLKFIRIVMYER